MNEQIIFEKATIDDIDEIINMYVERITWLKEREIKQWSRYLINHPREEFIRTIEDGRYYVLKKNDVIIAGFEISVDSQLWNDNITNAYYLYKIVVKVGYKDIGKEIFEIAKQIAKQNQKDYLRIDCLKFNKKLNEIYTKHGFKYVSEGKCSWHYILRECKV